jgi:hypothetical protein
MRKTMLASIAAALVLAGCGGAHAASSGMRSSTQGPAPLTANQGAAICNDLKAWLAQAENQGAPRFSPQLTTDENKALNSGPGVGQQLGLDLQALDTGVQQNNALGLGLYEPPLTADCNGYGVSIPKLG